jgi:outer membrane lipoprotein
MPDMKIDRKPGCSLMLALTCLALASCATPAFRDVGSAIAIDPSDVQQSGDRYNGAEVVWGGRIISVENREQTTDVEVVAYPLDRDQQPMPDLPTVGRFILVLPGFVEPFDYPVGRHLSVHGIVAGTQVGRVDAHDYLYPLLRAREVTVWPWGFMFDKKPRVSVGVRIR